MKFLETDRAGNIYVLAIVGGDGLMVDSVSLTGYSEVGVSATVDFMLSSFTPDGRHRWSKVIGGRDYDFGYALKADSTDGIYVTGYVENVKNNPVGPPNTAVHFDTDTILPRIPYDSNFAYIEDTLRQSMFLLKYDTAGTFQWLAMPEPDTMTFDLSTYRNISSSLDLDIAPNGNLFWLCHLSPGKFRWETDSIIPTHGVYVVEYSQSGQQISLSQLQMHSSNAIHLSYYWGGVTFFKRNPVSGDYVVAGRNIAKNTNGWITIGGDTLQSDSYIASFSSSGQLQWLHESAGVDEMQIEALNLDPTGNIYITGAVKRNTILAGHIYTSPVGAVSPFVTALDATGSHLWSSMAVPGGMSTGQGIEVVDDEVVITGYSGQMYWPSHADTLKTAPNQGYDGFITRFEILDGSVISMDRTVTNFGGGSWGNAITAGPANTFYIGGNFDQGMYMGNDTLYKVGSQRSFFLTKYQCDVPEPSFSVSGNNDSNSVTLTYTGPLADSVQWFMGDGTQYWGDVVQHTYGADSVYRICVRAYFECTDVMICDSIHAGSIGMREVVADDITFYPNPTTGQLTIDGLPEPGILRLYSLEGTLLNSEATTESTHHMELGSYPAGVYVLEYHSRKGISTFRKVIVE
ncbi:T9SS type A sorting domain-containing protein [Phaeocystidibacter luteus]|uniref:T9SS type A sorting domain-containing protein n=1 Tax=Phaeocystidibacter luteus TaxID=911197 RepID=UPI001CB9C677|nr:T9SS type A sorting domain-containing protein [Phaeocystidibacter luteus]